jgi:hypothetical protein
MERISLAETPHASMARGDLAVIPAGFAKKECL